MTTREVGPLLFLDQAGPRHQAFRQIRLANRSMSMASLPESIRPEDTIFLQVSIV